MAQSLFKFFGIWLGVALLFGVVLFLVNGSTDALDPALETARLQNCDGAGGSFSGDQAQECLAQVERTLTSLLGDTRSDLLFWHAISSLAVLLIGLLFIVRIVTRAATAGGPLEFRSMRGAWFVHAMAIASACIAAAALAHFGGYFGNWGALLTPARGWGIPALMVAVWCATFWFGSRVATPDKMRPSIPGG